MRDIYNSLGIEKRRSSAYHSKGNGFAERNIRSVKDLLRSVLLHRKQYQGKWRSILPELVFALNASTSKVTKYSPYEIVFGRQAVLPQDILFGVEANDQHDPVTIQDYESEVSSLLQDTFDHVIKALQLNQRKMQEQYNRGIRFHDYAVGQNVWLKVKHYKTGENRKLAPRRDGPWTIVQKLPNGVNFKIENRKKEQKVVHHDRLLPVKSDQITVDHPAEISGNDQVSDSESSDDPSYSSASEHSYSDDEENSDDNVSIGDVPIRNYPRRDRRTRTLPGAIPWNAIRI